MSRIRPVIIAGGPGARLWPLSDAARPKPFLKLDGKSSLLDQTIVRFAAPELFLSPIIACAAAHAEPARAALRAGGFAAPELILEPEPRDTAAAVAAVVAARIAAGAQDEIILIAPADHVIENTAAFRAGCERGLAAAGEGRLVLFGATPTEPHPGFGYIAPDGDSDVAAVASFQEKPDLARAKSFVADGYLWNMGLFLGRASTFEALFRAHAPAIYEIASRAVREGATAGGALTLAPKVFAGVEKRAFDRAVVELAKTVAVVRLSVGWSDVGAWDAVYETLPTDADGNAIVGDVRLLDVRDCLVHSSGPRVAAIGVEGLAIVATGDAVLVCRLDDAQQVKALVDAMKKETR